MPFVVRLRGLNIPVRILGVCTIEKFEDFNILSSFRVESMFPFIIDRYGASYTQRKK